MNLGSAGIKQRWKHQHFIDFLPDKIEIFWLFHDNSKIFLLKHFSFCIYVTLRHRANLGKLCNDAEVENLQSSLNFLWARIWKVPSHIGIPKSQFSWTDSIEGARQSLGVMRWSAKNFRKSFRPRMATFTFSKRVLLVHQLWAGHSTYFWERQKFLVLIEIGFVRFEGLWHR